MGLESNSGKGKVFLKITDGKIAMRVDEGSPGAVKCTNKEGSKIWFEKHFGSISGYITNVYKREGKFGNDLCIEITDDQVYELQVGWSSRYSSGFFLAMPNIDFNSKVVFNPWFKVVNDQKKSALYINKEGSKDSYPWFWTKENPGDCPPMVQLKVKGELIWDDSSRQEFFEAYLNDKILPKLNKLEISEEVAVQLGEESSELPF